MVRVFKLNLNTERLGDPAYDAVILPTEHSNKFRYYFSNPNLYGIENLPSEISFLSNFNYLPEYDIPFTDSGLFIISSRTEKILSSIDFCNYYITVPVVMIDDTYLKERLDKDGNLKKDVPVIRDYMAIRLSYLLDCFDYDKSDFRPLRSNPKAPGRIRKLVLKEPSSGFPPIFRVNVISSAIFVSEEVKNLLEQNDIKGCVFEEVEVSVDSDNQLA